MTDTLTGLIRLAEMEGGPAHATTAWLINEASELLLPDAPPNYIQRLVRARIRSLLEIRAYREAAIILMEEALPEWEWTKQRHDKVTVLRHSPFLVFDADHPDLARAILIAVLRAKQAMEAAV